MVTAPLCSLLPFAARGCDFPRTLKAALPTSFQRFRASCRCDVANLSHLIRIGRKPAAPSPVSLRHTQRFGVFLVAARGESCPLRTAAAARGGSFRVWRLCAHGTGMVRSAEPNVPVFTSGAGPHDPARPRLCGTHGWKVGAEPRRGKRPRPGPQPPR